MCLQTLLHNTRVKYKTRFDKCPITSFFNAANLDKLICTLHYPPPRNPISMTISVSLDNFPIYSGHCRGASTPLLISTIQRVFEIHLQSLVPTNQPVPLPQLNAQTTVSVMNRERADGTTQRICPTNPCLNIPIIPLLVHLIPFRFVPNDQITIIILN